ncbi:hypothetical protein GCM10007108_01660 [Thermogymnomonas acidicola]|uniref:Phosphopantetheine adenylyltransferase n=1 Tax=Thermogymnomonas acidicola TaxID=399579 RepID=A0AA37BPP3_9ARCH|nr:pantetheine-phosphate adenylyltransferase [Thermogymnomonas acidicola]GGM67241.1 hypothetical protein GCM10007108_01660 [Thermogymnomonas acidicola]
MITIVGGTFAYMHRGHRAMLRAAAESGNEVIVGLTTDRYLREHKAYSGPNYEERKRRIEEFLSTFGIRFTVQPLDTQTGNSETSEQYSAIVVSPETQERAMAINKNRERAGLRPLRIIKVPYILASDLFPISSTRIYMGEIDTEGRRVSPLRVGISTGNALKEQVTKAFFERMAGNVQVFRNTEYSTGSQQPMGEDTVAFARDRAFAALRSLDYGIGIESGCFWSPLTGKVFDVHVCAVVDRYGYITYGMSSGFEVPEPIVERIKRGQTTSQAYFELTGEENIGNSEGIVGRLSRSSVTRASLIEESLRNALIPRMDPEFYGRRRFAT